MFTWQSKCEPGSGAVLQQAWNGRAMDQRQAGGEDDAAELPSVPGQRGAPVAERARLQPGKSLAAAGVSEEDREPGAQSDRRGDSLEPEQGITSPRPVNLRANGRPKK